MKKILNIIFPVCFSILIITGIIKFTVGFKELYYYDIDKLNIPILSNLSEEEIMLNYDYLIDYNLGKDDKNFEMPTIKSSPQGKIHFEEVRDIFQNINKLFNLCLIISIIGLFINIKYKNIKFLNVTSKSLISIPIILALPIVINFEGSFVIFHKLMFSNDYWIFDPNLDPVIDMLPQQFFFHTGVMMLSLVLISSILMYVVYRLLNIKRER
ncbi:TIGR01906 family membrane protein [Romboutsia sedimentorum]|uniref:TIGR01906 family membrane protein n=1 Tax=Romboutsia sedimentorum TaxID=1368474 RepID=A0ABT7ECN8_9FIRM|nr:TIGR01906 family membrane protein [Romboutsia sedimentorum]MDK2564709.1 TIGR01906 family membrane protein [Romboutsia sedimentorum]MDK2586418.1 TIGR01906 family membrane protein [Romboutsia sedimentorum]